ncbi:MAG: hypothetical protein VXX11_03700 [Planctomycetota bacterium]|nr:hypothetical protein [Planctomycetota bacterium]
MSDKNHVRNRAIKMAFENPHLREKMLPLIKKLSGDKATTQEGAERLFEKYMDGLTPEGRKNTKKKPQDFYEKPSEDKKQLGDKSTPDGIHPVNGNFTFPDLSKTPAKDLPKEVNKHVKNLTQGRGFKLEDLKKTKAWDAVEDQIQAHIDNPTMRTDGPKDAVLRKLIDKALVEATKNAQPKSEKKPSDSKSESKSKPSGGSSAKPQHKGERDKALMDFFDGTDLSPNEKRVIIDEVNSHIEEARSNVKWRAIETDTGHTPHGLIKELKGNIVETIDERMDGIDFDFEKLTPLAEKLFESAKKEPYNDPRAKSEKKPRENGELPIGDKGQQKRKQMSKADKLKAYQEAIKNSKSMSPEDKKKALEKSKKPGFDADAALGAMGEDEEEDGGKKASLRTQVIRLAHENPELRKDLLPLLQQAKVASMPRKDKRPATPKSRQEWGHWFENDLRMRLEAVGASEGDIDHAINAINHNMYGVLKLVDDKKAWPLSQGYRHFRTNADIYAWATGRGKLSEFTYNPNIPELPDLQTYPKWVKYVTSQARTAGKKVASMPPANNRPAGEKSRRKWAYWLTTDIQTKLEEAGCPQSAIDDAVYRVCDWRYGILFNKRFHDGKFYSFKTNADIHAWVTGRAKLTDLSPTYDGSPGFEGRIQGFTESYLMLLKWYIAKYGSANSGAFRDKAKAMMNKCKAYQLVLAGNLLGRGDRSFRSDMRNPGNVSKELEQLINDADADYLKKIMPALEWASKCPEPPKSALSL